MTNASLDESKVRWLTYLVYFLLAILTVVTAWNTEKLTAMQETLPRDYVRLERYQTDNGRMECTLGNISTKLDRLIERQIDDGKERK